MEIDVNRLLAQLREFQTRLPYELGAELEKMLDSATGKLECPDKDCEYCSAIAGEPCHTLAFPNIQMAVPHGGRR